MRRKLYFKVLFKNISEITLKFFDERKEKLLIYVSYLKTMLSFFVVYEKD
jgi:hypothetical protein